MQHRNQQHIPRLPWFGLGGRPWLPGGGADRLHPFERTRSNQKGGHADSDHRSGHQNRTYEGEGHAIHHMSIMPDGDESAVTPGPAWPPS
jgi:hypothetical protein